MDSTVGAKLVLTRYLYRLRFIVRTSTRDPCYFNVGDGLTSSLGRRFTWILLDGSRDCHGDLGIRHTDGPEWPMVGLGVDSATRRLALAVSVRSGDA